MKILKPMAYAISIFFILGFTGNPIGTMVKSKVNEQGKETLSVNAQDCHVQTNTRPDGATIRYTRPTMVGRNNLLEYGMSIQTNGEEYFLGSVIRFYGVAKKPVGKLNIQYTSSESSSLELYQSELTHLNGSEVYISLYRLDEADIKRFQRGSLKNLNFTTEDGRMQIVTVTNNRNVLQAHYNCLNR